jgi:hypothetical protein
LPISSGNVSPFSNSRPKMLGDVAEVCGFVPVAFARRVSSRWQRSAIPSC